MTIKLNGERYYWTAEACRTAGISKNTFLRWVRDGTLADVAYRDRRGWRLFTEDDITRIKAETYKMTTPHSPMTPKPVDRVPHILVVDDEPTVGRLFKDTLQKHKYQVTTTCDSREALKLVTKRRFDLKMPEIDGSELLRRIRSMGNHAQVAVIAGAILGAFFVLSQIREITYI